MENYQKLYPHISPEMAQTLQEIAASPEQWQSSDAAAKSQIDTMMARYHLGPGNMTFVVIGTSGAGKSATANTLLGRKVFKEGGSAVPMTTTFQVEKTNVGGVQLTVVDTPLTWNTQIQAQADMNFDDVFYIIVVNLASPRFDQAELECLKTLKGPDDKSVLTPGQCLVVLTHADSALQQSSLEQYIKEIKGDPLHELLTEHVKGTILAINNSPTTEYEQKRHQQAMLMNTMVAMNGQRTTPTEFLILIYMLFVTVMAFIPRALERAIACLFSASNYRPSQSMVAMNGQRTTPTEFLKLIYKLFAMIIAFVPLAIAHEIIRLLSASNFPANMYKNVAAMSTLKWVLMTVIGIEAIVVAAVVAVVATVVAVVAAVLSCLKSFVWSNKDETKKKRE